MRANLGFEPADSLCPFDAALSLGLIVQFTALPSLEGMYDADKQAIVIGSQRPPGRRRFTCAHELGHHVFGHGTRFDQLETADSDEEYLADSFAAAFLMPKTAIDAALSRRGWSQRPLTDEMIFVVAQDLGVGYATLVNHLALVLRYVAFRQKAILATRKPLQIRKSLAGFALQRDLFLVDDGWGTRAVDVEVGDALITPPDSSINNDALLTVVTEPREHIIATAPGQAGVILPSGRSIVVRISREDYTGRAKNRHLEDVDDEYENDPGGHGDPENGKAP
jgi:hypothetical protein